MGEIQTGPDHYISYESARRLENRQVSQALINAREDLKRNEHALFIGKTGPEDQTSAFY